MIPVLPPQINQNCIVGEMKVLDPSHLNLPVRRPADCTANIEPPIIKRRNTSGMEVRYASSEGFHTYA